MRIKTKSEAIPEDANTHQLPIEKTRIRKTKKEKIQSIEEDNIEQMPPTIPDSPIDDDITEMEPAPEPESTDPPIQQSTNKFPELMIDEGFEKLITPLTKQEFNNLRESILKDNVRDPIVVWGNIIVDGHNRYKICKEHNIIPNIVSMKFSNRMEAEEWIIRNQFSRRNLSIANKTYMIGKLYNRLKGDRLDNLKQNAKKSTHDKAKRDVAKDLSEQYSFSPSSIKKASKFADVIDRIQNEEKKIIILNRQANVKINDVIALHKLPIEQVDSALEKITGDDDSIILKNAVINKHPQTTAQIEPNQPTLTPEQKKQLQVYIANIKSSLIDKLPTLQTIQCPQCLRATEILLNYSLTIKKDTLEMVGLESRLRCLQCLGEIEEGE